MSARPIALVPMTVMLIGFGRDADRAGEPATVARVLIVGTLGPCVGGGLGRVVKKESRGDSQEIRGHGPDPQENQLLALGPSVALNGGRGRART